LLIAKHGGGATHYRYMLIKIADLWAAQARYEAAIELFTLVCRYPQGLPWSEIDIPEKFRQLQAKVSADVFAAAQERGRARDFGATVKEVLAELSQPSSSPKPQPLHDPLTARELEILGMIADGLSNQEIADQLILSLGTVKWYTGQIYSKLGVQN